jgi:hypothetical protein
MRACPTAAVRVRKGRAEERIGAVYITPCPSKIVSILEHPGMQRSYLDAAVSISDLFQTLAAAISKVSETDADIDGGETAAGVAWAFLAGLPRSLSAESTLSVAGLPNVIRILDDVEKGKLRRVSSVPGTEQSECDMERYLGSGEDRRNRGCSHRRCPPAWEIRGGCASDLLSNVTGNSREGDICITMQKHVNIAAVAQLNGLAGIVLANGRQPEPETPEGPNRNGCRLSLDSAAVFWYGRDSVTHGYSRKETALQGGVCNTWM